MLQLVQPKRPDLSCEIGTSSNSILKGDAFGLAGSVRVPPQYNLEALDQSLSGFEDLLRATKGAVNRDLIASSQFHANVALLP